jgi:hypothetical protein
MSTIKQHGNGDNAHQRTYNISQLFKNSNSKNIIKIVFDIYLHHNPINVYVKEVFDVKKDGFIASKDQNSKLMKE